MGEIVKIELFWQLTLKAYNLHLECPISKLKLVFSSSLIGLSDYVFSLTIYFGSIFEKWHGL